MFKYFFLSKNDIISTNINIAAEIKKYKYLLSCETMPTDAIVNKDIPGSINKNVYREYFIKLTSVMPYAKFCMLYGNKGTNLVIIKRSIAFLFPSSNKSLFKYLFFSTIGFTASLRKNLEIKKEITAAKVMQM